jgi:membrane protease YdiL (CAAX protease family)
MSQLTPDGLVGDAALAAGPASARRTALIGAAWLATLLLSNLPLIVARELLGRDIPWMMPIWLGTALLLVAATFVWPSWRSLRSYFVLMGLIVLLLFGLQPSVVNSASWQRLFAARSPLIEALGARLYLVAATLLVLLVALGLGVGRRELFLQPGTMKAPVQGLSLPGGRRLSWALFGTVMTVLLAALFSLFALGPLLGRPGWLALIAPWLPLILLNALLNAFGEESMYRAAPLAMLLPAIPARHAIAMTALWFGLGHFYGGVPSGLMGLIGPGLLALLMGKAMVDTRGMGWPWLLHVVIDVVVFTSLAVIV